MTGASQIDSVIVFPDQAQVTRSVKVQLAEGEQTLVVADLPVKVDPESVRVSAVSAVGVQIGSVDLRDVVPPPEVPLLSSEVEQHLHALEAERAALDDTIAAADAKRRLIERLGTAVADGLDQGIGKGVLPASSLKETWAAFGDGLTETMAVERDAHARQKAIDDELARIHSAMGHKPSGTRPHGEARVALAATGAGEATFQISYRMARAGWQPVYDARLTLGSGTEKPVVELVTRGLVRQSTGEDWTNADLTLSTARPSKGTSAPDIRPMIVQYAPPPFYAEPRAQSAPIAKSLARSKAAVAPDEASREADAVAPVAAPAPPPQKPAEEQQAQLDTGGISAVYHIPGRVTVETGTGGRSVKISESSLEPQLSVKTAPKQVALAYLTAAFRPKGDSALLPGKVSIYRNGQFVGIGAIPFVAAGDDVKLGFGEDDHVRVERNAVKQAEGETGIFGSTHVEVRDFRIRIKNLHDRPIPVTVEDQIPVSENTDLIVEKLSTMTAPSKTNVDDRRGVVAWNFDLKPGEDKEIRVGWRLKYPVDRYVSWQSADK